MATIDELTKTRFENDKHRFITNLMFTSNWIKNLFVEFLKPYGISTQQYNILRILREADDWVAMHDIKRLMIEKSPNATRLADKLLAKKLIKRGRGAEDRRHVYLHISEEGLQLLEAIDQDDQGEHVDFINRISEEEASLLNPIMDKLRG